MIGKKAAKVKKYKIGDMLRNFGFRGDYVGERMCYTLLELLRMLNV